MNASMNPMVGNMMNNMIQKTIQGNPVLSLLSAMKNGGNPQVLLRQMAQKDPRAAQAMKMMEGKSPAQLENMVRNMCAERHTSVEEVARSLGLQMPQGK